jgi:hypothetical protein
VWNDESELLEGCASYLTGIWGSGPEDVYVAGGQWSDQSLILHSDGDQWEEVYVHENTSGWLSEIQGRGPDDVYAVGLRGKVLHFDGTLPWTAVATGFGGGLRSVWTAAATPVYAVGGGGAILSLEP